MKKKVLSMALAFVMIFGTALTSFAAEFDLIHKTGNPKYSFVKFAKDSAVTKEVGKDLANYVMEYKGKYYNTKDIQDFMEKNPGKTVKDAVESGIAAQPNPNSSVDVVDVKSISKNIIKVQLKEALSVKPSVDDFVIEGLRVTGVEFEEKDGALNKQVLIVNTEDQKAQKYTLVFSGKKIEFEGSEARASVLLSSDVKELVLDTASSEIPTALISVELGPEFPQGVVATIDFKVDRGTVKRVNAKAGEVATTKYRPQEEKVEYTDSITARVVDVKDPLTGKEYPEYKNAKINQLEIMIKIGKNDDDTTVKVFNVKGVHTDRADRVYLNLNATENIMSRLIEGAPINLLGKLIDSSDEAKRQEGQDYQLLYYYIHDMYYSQLDAAVDKAKAAIDAKPVAEQTVENLKAELEKEMALVTKEWTKEKLRSELLHSVYDKTGRLYDKLPTAAECSKNVKACDAVLYIEGSVKPYLQDIIDYYKLIAKIVVLDNVKDTVSPKYPEFVYLPEHLYKDAQGQVVAVLPGRRVENVQYQGAEAEVKVKPAAYLMDNQAHQVIFLNSTIEDKYFLVGNPTFKLEDSTKLELKDTITAEDKNYKCLRNWLQVKSGKQPGGCAVPSYCTLPWVAEGSAGTPDPIVNPGGCSPIQPNPGQSCTDCNVSGVGHDMKDPLNTIPMESYRVKAKAQTVKNAKGEVVQDALAEIQVVFSEPVLTYKTSTDKGSYANRRASGYDVELWSRSILNPHNWTIDGYNLGRDVLDKGNNLNIRMVSTSVEKQSRDAVVITLDAAKGQYNEFIDRLLNDAANTEHSITVAKSGDWASATDTQNIVASNNDNFKAMSVEKATPWYPSIAGGTEEATDLGIQAKHYGRAFVVMAAAHKDVDDPTKPGEKADIIHVLFSEPMDWTDKDYGVQLFKTYALNSEPLVTKARDIVRGLRGVADYEDSPCAVTIVLPVGTLQANQMFSVVKAKGANDHLEAKLENASLEKFLVEERHALPYAAQPTFRKISEKKLEFNGCSIVYNTEGFAEKFGADFIPTPSSVYTKLGLKVPSFAGGPSVPAGDVLGEYEMLGIGANTVVTVYPKAPIMPADIKSLTINGKVYTGADLDVQADYVEIMVNDVAANITKVEVELNSGKKGVVTLKGSAPTPPPAPGTVLGEHEMLGIGANTVVTFYPTAPATPADVKSLTINGKVYTGADLDVQATYVEIMVNDVAANITKVEVELKDGKTGTSKLK